MLKVDFIQQSLTFLKQPLVMENGQEELTHYLTWYLITQVPDSQNNSDISITLPRYIADAMKYLRVDNDVRVRMYRMLFLEARGENVISDLSDMSVNNKDRDSTITFVSQLIGKITGDKRIAESIAAYLRSPVTYNLEIQKALSSIRAIESAQQGKIAKHQQELDGENHAKETFAWAYRRYLIAEVQAARKNMLIVEKSNFRSTVYFTAYNKGPEEQHTYWQKNLAPDWYSKDYKSFMFVFEDARDEEDILPRPPRTYDEIRAMMTTTYPTKSYDFSLWEDAVNFYLDLYAYGPVWFRVQRAQLLNPQNWRKTKKQVLWEKRGYTLFTRTEQITEKVILLDSWELIEDIESAWYTEKMLENELSKRMNNITLPPDIFFIPNTGFLSSNMHTHSIDALNNTHGTLIHSVSSAASHWRDSDNRVASATPQGLPAELYTLQETLRQLVKEVSRQTPTTTLYWTDSGGTVYGSYTEAQMFDWIEQGIVDADTYVNINNGGWILASQVLTLQAALAAVPSPSDLQSNDPYDQNPPQQYYDEERRAD